MVAREQLCLVIGDFNVEPTQTPCLAKGISAGLWVDLEAAWAFASGRQPGLLASALGILLVGPGGISWLAALVLLLRFLVAWFWRIGNQVGI